MQAFTQKHKATTEEVLSASETSRSLPPLQQPRSHAGTSATTCHTKTLTSPFALESSVAATAHEGQASSSGQDEATSRLPQQSTDLKVTFDVTPARTITGPLPTQPFSGIEPTHCDACNSPAQVTLGDEGDDVAMDVATGAPTVRKRCRRPLRALMRAVVPLAAAVLFNKWHADCKVQRWSESNDLGTAASSETSGVTSIGGASCGDGAAPLSARAGRMTQRLKEQTRVACHKVHAHRDWCAVGVASALSVVLG